MSIIACESIVALGRLRMREKKDIQVNARVCNTALIQGSHILLLLCHFSILACTLSHSTRPSPCAARILQRARTAPHR